MANKKFTQLTDLPNPAGTDILAIVDDAAIPTTKKVTVANLMAQAPQGDLQAANNLSDLANIATARTILGVDPAGTDNSTDVTLGGTPDYITINGQVITRNQIDLSADVTGSLPHTSVSGLGTAATSASTDFSPAFYSTVSETGTSRTLSDSDNGKVIVCTNAATITVTIPSTLTAGFSCKLVQGGAGIVGVVAGSGTTLSLIGGRAYTSGQYQVVDVINYASNAYVLDSNSLQVDPAAWSGNTYSISLDGVSDYASFTQTSFTSTNRSWSFWYKFSSTPSAIIPLVGGTANYIGLNPSNGYIYQSGPGGTGSNFALGALPGTTNWHNLVVTDNGAGTVNMYLDGSALSVNTSLGAQGTYSFQYIGRQGSVYFPGNLDEISHYTSILSAGQATNIYKGEDDGGSGGTNGTAGDLSTFSPEHWWRMGDFEGGTGTSVTDQGGASSTLDLTLSGASFASDAP